MSLLMTELDAFWTASMAPRLDRGDCGARMTRRVDQGDALASEG
jgi:hypothetical protein